MAIINTIKKNSKRTLALLMSLIVLIGIVSPAAMAADTSWKLGDVAYTADRNTLPEGEIPVATEWSLVRVHDAEYSCGRDEHRHGLGCIFGCEGEHSHKDSGCTVVGPAKAEWKLVENRDSAIHLDIHIALTATYTYDGEAYTAEVELTKADYENGNLQITATAPFSITGTTIHDAGQRRFNGSFPVGTSENPVLYTVKLSKNVDFVIDGETVSVPMTFERTVHFWHEDNICETLTQSRTKLASWKEGKFVEAGMDFKLGASYASGSTPDPVDPTEPEPQPVYYTVVTKYVDLQGNELAESVSISLLENSAYITSAATIEGYTLERTEGDAVSGTVNGNKEVIYVYAEVVIPEPEPQPVYYTVVTKYVDLQGNELADSISETLLENSDYTTSAATIEGYTLERTEGDAANGTVDGDKEVIYVYSEIVIP
ncbi:MAG: MucBP domain-containing protein, partial [Clostridia bacterium]|nr:MucBP domain-containing protein [Clostridia bacterium]